MVDEGWTLSDAIAFAEEYKLTLSVYDSTNNLIPSEEYTKLSSVKVISQSRPVGDTIIEGFNFKININTQYKTNDKNENTENNTNNNTDTNTETTE